MILLPGLAADARMYGRVRKSLVEQPCRHPFNLVLAELLVPEVDEDMEAYAGRTAAELHLRPNDIIGGCSFGSMVASAIARMHPVSALVLLGGSVDSSALRRSGKWLNRCADVVPFGLMQRFLASNWFLHAVFGAADKDEIELGRSMLLDTPEQTLRRGGVLATTYRAKLPLSVPVYAMHGALDRVLKPPQVQYCHLVPDAGHGMVVSHAQEVAEFLCTVVAEIRG